MIHRPGRPEDPLARPLVELAGAYPAPSFNGLLSTAHGSAV
jgi:hypothetical protein